MKEKEKATDIYIYDTYNHYIKQDGICGTLTCNCGSGGTNACGLFWVITKDEKSNKCGN